jgi:hypothetical protein
LKLNNNLPESKPTPEPASMEVHHHPDLHHKRKNFREYFLEFLMIFLAVTMGFFAESLRENMANGEKERQYMHSMIEDLKKDTTEVNGEILYATAVMHGLDSLFHCLHSKILTDSVQKRLYLLNAKYSRLMGVQFSDEASTQLKASGEMRLIGSREVANKITSYWKMSSRLQDDDTYFNSKMNSLGDESNKIFDRIYIENYSHSPQNGFGMLGIVISPEARLMSLDNTQLIEHANKVIVLFHSLQQWYLPSLHKQKTAAASLIQQIEKTYHFE